MKRNLVCLLAVVFLVSVTGCDKKETKVHETELTADMLLSEDEVKALVGYEPVKTVSDTVLKSMVRYDSEPQGEYPVIVELYSYNKGKSVAEIYEQFTEKKERRPSSQEVNEYDAQAYIAYPSVNIYRDGYMAVVTAGSGANDEQGTLLKNAGAVVAGHLVEFLNENPTDSNLID